MSAREINGQARPPQDMNLVSNLALGGVSGLLGMCVVSMPCDCRDNLSRW